MANPDELFELSSTLGGMGVAFTGVYASMSGSCIESLGGDASAEFGNTSGAVTDTPQGATASSVIGGTVGVSISSQEGPDAIIEVFFRNQMPYTAIEKRAEQVYGALNGNDDLLKRPVLIAESQDALETICQALDNSRGESVLEKLDLYEKLLEELSH